MGFVGQQRGHWRQATAEVQTCAGCLQALESPKASGVQGSPKQGEEIRARRFWVAFAGGFGMFWFILFLVHFFWVPFSFCARIPGFLAPTESQLGARLGKINREEMRSFFRGFGHPKADVLDDHVVLQ